MICYGFLSLWERVITWNTTIQASWLYICTYRRLSRLHTCIRVNLSLSQTNLLIHINTAQPTTTMLFLYISMYELAYVHVYMYSTYSKQNNIPSMNRIARYICGNNVWRIARKRKKIAIGGYKFGTGSRGTIATPSPGVYTVGAILVV